MCCHEGENDTVWSQQMLRTTDKRQKHPFSNHNTTVLVAGRFTFTTAIVILPERTPVEGEGVPLRSLCAYSSPICSDCRRVLTSSIIFSACCAPPRRSTPSCGQHHLDMRTQPHELCRRRPVTYNCVLPQSRRCPNLPYTVKLLSSPKKRKWNIFIFGHFLLFQKENKYTRKTKCMKYMKYIQIQYKRI